MGPLSLRGARASNKSYQILDCKEVSQKLGQWMKWRFPFTVGNWSQPARSTKQVFNGCLVVAPMPQCFVFHFSTPTAPILLSLGIPGKALSSTQGLFHTARCLGVCGIVRPELVTWSSMVKASVRPWSCFCHTNLSGRNRTKLPDCLCQTLR